MRSPPADARRRGCTCVDGFGGLRRNEDGPCDFSVRRRPARVVAELCRRARYDLRPSKSAENAAGGIRSTLEREQLSRSASSRGAIKGPAGVVSVRVRRGASQFGMGRVNRVCAVKHVQRDVIARNLACTFKSLKVFKE